MPTLITAMSMTGPDGREVPFIQGADRAVTNVTGLAGMAAREVTVARSGQSGSRILTRFRDEVPIVISGIIGSGDPDTAWSVYDDIAGVLASAVTTDCLLKWTAGNSLALQRRVRLTSMDGPLDGTGPDMIIYQATLRPSDPNAYSQTQYTSSATPLGSTAGGGMAFPVRWPVHYSMPASTAAAYTNRGFVPTPPMLTLTGFLDGPTVTLTATGDQLVFVGQLAAGDVLTVDVAQRTILLNGTANRLNLLNPAKSTWFELPPGSGSVTLGATRFGVGAGVTVTWRDARN